MEPNPIEGKRFEFTGEATFEAEVVSAGDGVFRLPTADFRAAGPDMSGPVMLMVTTPDGGLLYLGGFNDLAVLAPMPVVELVGEAEAGARVRVEVSRPS
jgi:hypothetical protein